MSGRCSAEVSRDSSMKAKAARIPITPIGMLMKKIQFQLMCSVIRPPTSGPIARASAETPAQMPIAVPRSCGGKVTVMIESVAGFISAAPSPWTTRAAIRIVASPARPHASDESVKMARPTTNIRRRPKRSASLPPVSMNAPKVSAYPATTHSSSDTWRPSDCWIEGSATFTTVLSSMIMKRPNATAASVHHFLFSSAKSLAFISRLPSVEPHVRRR